MRGYDFIVVDTQISDMNSSIRKQKLAATTILLEAYILAPTGFESIVQSKLNAA